MARQIVARSRCSKGVWLTKTVGGRDFACNAGIDGMDEETLDLPRCQVAAEPRYVKSSLIGYFVKNGQRNRCRCRAKRRPR